MCFYIEYDALFYQYVPLFSFYLILSVENFWKYVVTVLQITVINKMYTKHIIYSCSCRLYNTRCIDMLTVKVHCMGDNFAGR